MPQVSPCLINSVRHREGGVTLRHLHRLWALTKRENVRLQSSTIVSSHQRVVVAFGATFVPTRSLRKCSRNIGLNADNMLLTPAHMSKRNRIQKKRVRFAVRSRCDADCILLGQEIVSAITSSGLAIRNVSLASNDIGDSGAGAVARLLDDEPPAYRCVLSFLDLRGNDIGSKGCQVGSFSGIIAIHLASETKVYRVDDVTCSDTLL